MFQNQILNGLILDTQNTCIQPGPSVNYEATLCNPEFSVAQHLLYQPFTTRRP